MLVLDLCGLYYWDQYFPPGSTHWKVSQTRRFFGLGKIKLAGLKNAASLIILG